MMALSSAGQCFLVWSKMRCQDSAGSSPYAEQKYLFCFFHWFGKTLPFAGDNARQHVFGIHSVKK